MANNQGRWLSGIVVGDNAVEIGIGETLFTTFAVCVSARAKNLEPIVEAFEVVLCECFCFHAAIVMRLEKDVQTEIFRSAAGLW